MEEGSNKSTAPKVGGSNQPAADKTDNQGDPNPEQKIKPRKRQARKWLGHTEAKWREIAGFVVLIPWIYNDLSDSHKFGKLLCLAASLAIAQGVACSFLKSRPKALIIWLASLIPLACIVFVNSRPEPALYPSFTTFIETPDGSTALTNDFINGAKFVKDTSKTVGFLVFPLQTDETNLIFRLRIRNDSFITIEDPLLAIELLANLDCVPDHGWEMAQMEGEGLTNINTDIPRQGWSYTFPNAILPGLSGYTPIFQIRNIPRTRRPFLSILIRIKDAPAVGFTMVLTPVSLPANFPPRKPFVIKGDLDSTNNTGINRLEFFKKLTE
jgi:hypothetical protein